MKRKNMCWPGILLAMALLTGCLGGSPETKSLGSSNGEMVVASAQGAYVETTVPGHGLGSIEAMYLSPDNEIIVVGLEENGLPAARCYKGDTGAWQELAGLDKSLMPQDAVYKPIYTVGGTWWLAGAGAEGTTLYRVANGSLQTVSLPQSGNIFNLAYDTTGSLLVEMYVEETRHSFILDAEEGTLLATPELGGEATFLYAGTSRFAAALPRENKVEVYDAASGEKTVSYAFNSVPQEALNLAPEENRVIAVTAEGIKVVTEGGVESIPVLGAETYAGDSYITGVAAKQEEYWVSYIVAGQSLVCRYTYSAGATAEEMLRVWSIEEQELVRIAAIVAGGVDYEVALQGDSAHTKSDVVHTLNAQLLAGDGPDVIILDGLNIGRLIELEMLENLSGIIDTSLYYENVLSAFVDEAGAYAYPTLFQPNIMARKTSGGQPLGSITSMREIQSVLLQGTEELYFAGHEDVFDTFYQPFAANMFPGGVFAEQEAIRDFLALTSGIVQSGAFVDKSKDTEYGLSIEGLNLEVPQSMWLYHQQPEVNYAFGTARGHGNTQFALGVNQNGRDVPPYEVALMPGNTFVPLCVVGVSATSQNKEAALDFVKQLFEMQTEEMAGATNLAGFMVRRGVQAAAHDARLRESGLEDIFLFSAEYGLDGLMDGLERPTEINYILQEKVYAEAVKLYAGTATLEDCVAAILQNTQLYFEELAE